MSKGQRRGCDGRVELLRDPSRIIDGVFVFPLQAPKSPEWLKKAQVGLEPGAVFTTRPTDCLQVCLPTRRPRQLSPILKLRGPTRDYVGV